jgi:hypothetical protein
VSKLPIPLTVTKIKAFRAWSWDWEGRKSTLAIALGGMGFYLPILRFGNWRMIRVGLHRMRRILGGHVFPADF